MKPTGKLRIKYIHRKPKNEREAFLQELRDKIPYYDSMPDWKKNLVRHSSKPTTDVPRTPIINQ